MMKNPPPNYPAEAKRQNRKEYERLIKEVAKRNLDQGNRKERLAAKARLRASVKKNLANERELGREIERQAMEKSNES